MAVLLPLKVSVLMPTTSPPIDLIASFNSLRLDNSATQGLQPLNQKLTTVTAFFENKLSSTGLPLKSLPDKLLKGDVVSVLFFLLLSEAVLFSISAICSSIFRIASISSVSVFNSASVKEALFHIASCFAKSWFSC